MAATGDEAEFPILLRHADGLERALAAGGATHSLGDVIRQILAGQAQLWESEDAIIITEIHETPRARVVHFWLATGELEAVISLSRQVLSWAEKVGCSRATLAGRRGWVRALKEEGWAPELVILSKEV